MDTTVEVLLLYTTSIQHAVARKGPTAKTMVQAIF